MPDEQSGDDKRAGGSPAGEVFRPLARAPLRRPTINPAKVTVRPDGRIDVENPSPLRDMPPKQRLVRVLGVLEAATMLGDVQAARELLGHSRWLHEVRYGKPTARVEVESSGSIRVVDSLGRAISAGIVEVAPASLGAGARSIEPPAGAASTSAHRRTRSSARGTWDSAQPPGEAAAQPEG